MIEWLVAISILAEEPGRMVSVTAPGSCNPSTFRDGWDLMGGTYIPFACDNPSEAAYIGRRVPVAPLAGVTISTAFCHPPR